MGYLFAILALDPQALAHAHHTPGASYDVVFSAAVYDFMNRMWWGIALGVFFVGLLSAVPRVFVMKILGDRPGLPGILRATAAGVLLDLCSHGILLVAMKLYERGARLAQVMAFLIASPWNSLSLTIILIALIGLGWTLVFIALSAVIAIISGLIFEALVNRGRLPDNPNTPEVVEDFDFWPDLWALVKNVELSFVGVFRMFWKAVKESRMVLRWLFLGIVMAALLRTFVPAEMFQTLFGPTLVGLGMSLLVATVLEVCSEGTTPIAADILTKAKAPGNSFTFLMAGVSTDYTEIMSLRDTTRSWKIALFLPLVTLPQIIALGVVLNWASF